MPPAEPTDRQVRADVYRIARTYLEVERGLRPQAHLERFLTPAEYRRHRKHPPDPFMRTGEAVLPTDIGRIHLDRYLPGQITATLPTRETDDHWGALVLHFARNRTGHWHLDQLERLTRPNVARQPDCSPSAHVGLDERICRVEAERRLVDAAHRATTTRLTEFRRLPAAQTTDGKEATRELRQQQRTWKRRRDELDQELERLRATRDLRQRLATTDLRPDRHPTELSEAQLEQILGPVPPDDWRRALRDGLIEEMHAYRRRWNITDPRSVLGATSTDPTHQRDRDTLADTLRASARTLGTGGRHSNGRSTAVNRAVASDQVRGVAVER